MYTSAPANISNDNILTEDVNEPIISNSRI